MWVCAGLVSPRGKVHGLARVAAALQSFSRWLKVGKNLDALVGAIQWLVRQTLRVHQGRRPEVYSERQAVFLNGLYGDGQDEYMFVTKGGETVPTDMHLALLAFLRVFDLEPASDGSGPCAPTVLTHWCYTEEDSVEHREGRAVGSPCCDSRDESVDKVLTPILAFIVGRSWGSMAVSRWTHTHTHLQR